MYGKKYTKDMYVAVFSRFEICMTMYLSVINREQMIDD